MADTIPQTHQTNESLAGEGVSNGLPQETSSSTATSSKTEQQQQQGQVQEGQRDDPRGHLSEADKRDADARYEEAIEEEYAKREGGA